jgi:hypothetical protein
LPSVEGGLLEQPPAAGIGFNGSLIGELEGTIARVWDVGRIRPRAW